MEHGREVDQSVASPGCSKKRVTVGQIGLLVREALEKGIVHAVRGRHGFVSSVQSDDSVTVLQRFQYRAPAYLAIRTGDCDREHCFVDGSMGVEMEITSSSYSESVVTAAHRLLQRRRPTQPCASEGNTRRSPIASAAGMWFWALDTITDITAVAGIARQVRVWPCTSKVPASGCTGSTEDQRLYELGELTTCGRCVILVPTCRRWEEDPPASEEKQAVQLTSEATNSLTGT